MYDDAVCSTWRDFSADTFKWIRFCTGRHLSRGRPRQRSLDSICRDRSYRRSSLARFAEAESLKKEPRDFAEEVDVKVDDVLYEKTRARAFSTSS